MRCYTVQAKGFIRYAGTNAKAKEIRNEFFIEQLNFTKKDVTIEDAEVPLAKAELLEFINDLCAKLDQT